MAANRELEISTTKIACPRRICVSRDWMYTRQTSSWYIADRGVIIWKAIHVLWFRMASTQNDALEGICSSNPTSFTITLATWLVTRSTAPHWSSMSHSFFDLGSRHWKLPLRFSKQMTSKIQPTCGSELATSSRVVRVDLDAEPKRWSKMR